MVWSQYLEEVKSTQSEHENSEDEEHNIPHNKPLDYDTWCTWYSNDLMNLWMSMKTYREDSGNAHCFLDDIDFFSFSQYCFQHSSKLRSKYPS